MNDGFTLAELSIASAITIVLFGFTLTLASFARKQFDARASNIEVAIVAQQISARLSKDLRHARAVVSTQDSVRIVGQNNARINYRVDGSVLTRNDHVIGGQMRIDSFSIDVHRPGNYRLAEYYVQLQSLQDSTRQTQLSSSVVLRGAPIWRSADDDR